MKHVKNIPTVYNIGYIDALLRALLGMAMLSPALLQVPKNFSEFEAAAVLALFSIYPLISAIIRWDPLYQLLDFRSTKEAVTQEQIIEQFLDKSRQFFRSLSGTTKVQSQGIAANDEIKHRKSA